MSTIRGHAVGLTEWSRRDPWRERMDVTIEKHLGRACALNDLAIEELPDVIGPLAMTALDCAFEDCCATVCGGRQQLRLRLPQAARLEARPRSTGPTLVRGGEPVRVIERTATKTLVAWDMIAARIVTRSGIREQRQSIPRCMSGSPPRLGRRSARSSLVFLVAPKITMQSASQPAHIYECPYGIEDAEQGEGDVVAHSSHSFASLISWSRPWPVRQRSSKSHVTRTASLRA